MGSSGRSGRRHSAKSTDRRSPFQRDRDRILYSSSFRRLDGITQIVRAGEADVFHNRLTHSIKVAQVGRRLTEHCLRVHPGNGHSLEVDPDVVEAACLAHDLGHPPFGHVGEQTLNDVLTRQGERGEHLDKEGFEGNAQSFRVVTKLAVRFPDCEGLNLTRATLSAVLKYPWKRDTSGESTSSSEHHKWGYYESEKADFLFCREGLTDGKRTIEAELMNWADDIAYSVHDLEDFHRCNCIPWPRIVGEDSLDREQIIENGALAWHDAPGDAEDRLRNAHASLSGIFEEFRSSFIVGPYMGTRDQRLAIRSITSMLIGRYIEATRVEEDDAAEQMLQVSDLHKDEVRVLKQIARDYILTSPSLAAQQQGQRRILERLFEDLMEDIEERKLGVLPPRFHHLLEDSDLKPARTAADCIASLTEGETISLYQRLTGLQSGSVLDPIVR